MAAGYLAVFLMPVLLVVGTWSNHPYLAFGTAMLVFPLARCVFGAYRRTEPIEWDEGVATFLDRLPAVYAVVLMLVVASLLLLIANGAAAICDGVSCHAPALLDSPTMPGANPEQARRQLDEEKACGRTAVGSMPNIRLCVRVRCAESANPAACAASVHEAPAIAASIARLMRSQSR
jgi:hypothetical protein